MICNEFFLRIQIIIIIVMTTHANNCNWISNGVLTMLLRLLQVTCRNDTVMLVTVYLRRQYICAPHSTFSHLPDIPCTFSKVSLAKRPSDQCPIGCRMGRVFTCSAVTCMFELQDLCSISQTFIPDIQQVAMAIWCVDSGCSTVQLCISVFDTVNIFITFVFSKIRLFPIP